MSRHVEEWLKREPESVEGIQEAYTQLSWMQRELLEEYEPQAYARFSDRVDDWLSNFPDDADRRAMYLLLRRIFFVGQEQINSLSRAAFDDIVCRWTIDRAGVDLLCGNLQQGLATALEHTWFCPVTDSMKINSFLKLNGLGGHEIRPDWLSLSQLADKTAIRSFVETRKIKRVVLLEDFVGSGTQMTQAVLFAVETLPSIPILVVPLICCPAGLHVGRELASKHANLQIEPVLALSEKLFVLPEAQEDEPAEFATARRLSREMAKDFGRDFADPLGFRDTGALIVLHTNCPDNTLPLIHDQGENWKAIFPRIPRG